MKTSREFCQLHSRNQMIKVAIRIKEKTSTLFDHISTNSKENISQSDIIDIGLSDQQMIYCSRDEFVTRKVLKEKTNKKT